MKRAVAERHYEKELKRRGKLSELQKDCEGDTHPGHWYPNPDYKAAPAKKKKAKKPADE